MIKDSLTTEPGGQIKSKRDIVDLLYANIFNGLIVTFLSISGLIFGFKTPATHDLKVTFWIAMMALIALRLSDGLYWRSKLRNTNYPPNVPYIRFALGCIFAALIWGSYTVILYPHMATLETACTMIIMSAMAGGSATVLAPSRALVGVYTTFLIMPLSIMALLDQRTESAIIGFLGIVFWVSMLSASMKSNSFIKHAIRLKHKNDELVLLMRHERNATAAINRELRVTNQKLDLANSTLEDEVTRRTNDIYRLSNRDPLTSLMNRTGFLRYFSSLLTQMKQHNNRLAVLFIDLDGFKQVNDGLGHQAGDSVLREVSHRLQKFCDADNISRWGGDEFVIIIPYANQDTAVAVGQAIRSSISNQIDVANSQVILDCTIGISLYPQHSNDAPELIQLADVTMYKQKQCQRGGVTIFNQQIFATLIEEQKLREGLRHAIERQQLYTVYQPIVDANTGELWAVEALIRWQFYDETVRPDRFIPLAEKTGLINDIGAWVLNRACIDAAQWPFDNVAVSVNVSVPQLMDDSFIKSIDRVLKSSGLPPERLHLEITESIFAENKTQFINQINALTSRNIKIAIDDFGTGYSSLSQIETLNFDHIKIDRSFVQNLEEGSDTIIRATILIANEFNVKTIAEGIETIEHADRLRAMGVDCLQGYYYAKPLPSRELLTWHIKNANRNEQK